MPAKDSACMQLRGDPRDEKGLGHLQLLNKHGPTWLTSPSVALAQGLAA